MLYSVITMRPTLEQVLDGIRAVLRTEILKGFTMDSCIGTTRAVIRVLRHFGYDAEPLPVAAYVYNAVMTKHIEDGTFVPSKDPRFNAWCDETGAWGVSVGAPTKDPNDWAGHLVAIVKDRSLLIDASIDQASRPHKGIHLPRAMIGRYHDTFLTGEMLHIQGGDGSSLVYQVIDNVRYKTAPDWTDSSRTKKAVKATIKYIEDQA